MAQSYELPAETLLPAVADPEFDRMAALTRRVLDAPVSMVSLVDKRCQVFPGAAGLSPELDAARTNGLEYSHCQYVVRSAEPLIVRDTRHVPELAVSLTTLELGLVAYAGMPLFDAAGTAIGSLCVLDDHPRDWSERDVELLSDLAAACSAQLQLRAITMRAAVSADRDRIGQELGQGVIRDLFGLSMTLGSVRSQVDGSAVGELSRGIDTVDAVISRIRSSIYDTGR